MNKKKISLKKPKKKSAGRDFSQNPAQTANPAVESTEGLLAESQSEQLESKHGPVQWKPWLDSYQDLRFVSGPSGAPVPLAGTLRGRGQIVVDRRTPRPAL